MSSNCNNLKIKLNDNITYDLIEKGYGFNCFKIPIWIF